MIAKEINLLINNSITKKDFYDLAPHNNFYKLALQYQIALSKSLLMMPFGNNERSHNKNNAQQANGKFFFH